MTSSRLTKKRPSRLKNASSERHGWIYGWHSVTHALQNPRRYWEMLCVTPELWERLQIHIPSLKSYAHKVRVVEASVLEMHLGSQALHQGVALQTQPLEHVDLEDLLPFQPHGRPSFVIALDQVEDPQNLGNIIRTAATFQAQGIIVTERHAPPLSATVLKAASGGIEYVPLIMVPNLTRALGTLKDKGFWVLGFAEEGEHLLSDIPLTHPAIFVMGSEGSGLRHLTKQTCDQMVRLPSSPQFPTLNVGSACAAAAYEWIRQNPLPSTKIAQT